VDIDHVSTYYILSNSTAPNVVAVGTMRVYLANFQTINPWTFQEQNKIQSNNSSNWHV